jgi:hypothetical protein
MSNGRKKNEDSWFSGWEDALVGIGAVVAVAGAAYLISRTQEEERTSGRIAQVREGAEEQDDEDER